MESWFLLDSHLQDPAINMATDEALLEHARFLDRPTLRFYGWNRPAATFGYFQRYAETSALTPLRPLIRRPTGGGIVPHNADWTYSLAFPPNHPWHALTASESYARVHSWLRDAMTALALQTELSQEKRVSGHGQCFVGAERFDLLSGQQKIAGAAQRRNRSGLLIQGSLQPTPANISRQAWQNAVCQVATQSWDVRWEPFVWPSTLQARIEAIAAGKYLLSSYNQQR